MENMIIVGMADLNIAKHPQNLSTIGLGSCVGIVLFDSKTQIGGMAHIMLPNSNEVRNNSNEAKFADTAIVKLLNLMIKAGAIKNNIIAKLAGGSQMFSFFNETDIMKIGQRNIIAAKDTIEKLSIKIVAEDTGGNYGRTIELYTETGALMIKTAGKGIKLL